MRIFDELADLRRQAAGRRSGFYVSKVSDALQSFRRVQHVPLWLDEGAMDRARRIASPILDVIPTAGARLAMLSEDGDPDRAAWIGQVWDHTREAMTVWLRANLASEPGRLELGANTSIHVRIATDSEGASDAFTMEALDDGSIKVETDRGTLTLDAGGGLLFENAIASLEMNSVGKVALKRGTTELLDQTSQIAGELSSLCTQVATSVTATLLGPQPLSNAGAMLGVTKVKAEAIGGLLDNMRIQ